MPNTVNDTLDSAEMLLERGELSAALQLLLTGTTPAPFTLEGARTSLLITKCNLELENYDEDLIDGAICVLRSTDEHALFAQAMSLKSTCRRQKGDLANALEPAIEAYAACLRINDSQQTAKCLNDLAYLCFLKGDENSAIRNYERAIELSDSVGDASRTLVFRANLARRLYRFGRVRESVARHEEIAEAILNGENKTAKFNFHLTYGMALALAGDDDEGLSEILKADEVGEESVRRKAQYLEYLGAVHLMRHEFAEAEDALREGLTLSLEIAPKSALVSQIKRLLADLCVETEQFSKARLIADEALAVAEGLSQHFEIAACYRVFAQCEAGEKRRDSARIWYGRSLERYTAINARYDLAVTRFLAAESGCFTFAETLAMLVPAQEYFERQRMAHWTRETKMAIDRHSRAAATASSSPHVAPAEKPEPKIVAISKKMRSALSLARQVAPTNMNVLISGETGTGKDMLAEFIHRESGRTGAFFSFNAAAVQDTVIESELFGYMKGAFTGAYQDKPGLFESAEKGTFFLNEVGDASLTFQAKLLQTLERRTVMRVGDNVVRPVDFRLIAATNLDLKERVKQGAFRQDLWHRLCEATIHLTPLNKRPEDIRGIVGQLLREQITDIDDGTVDRIGELFAERGWPGNVREIKHELSFLVVRSYSNPDELIRLAKRSVQRARAHEAVKRAGGNQRAAARELGIPESTLRSLLGTDFPRQA